MKRNNHVMINEIQSILQELLQDRQVAITAVSPETSLYEDGIGLDSLDTAAFSSMLESMFGTDPYSVGAFPETVADVVRFYEGSQQA